MHVERQYRRLWAALHRPDDPSTDSLRQHEREVLAHIGDGASLGWLAGHLLLPKSTASVLVKDLERRGYVVRRRDDRDERRLRITLTERGAAVTAADHVLDLSRLAVALRHLPPDDRAVLGDLLERLADAASGDPSSARPG